VATTDTLFQISKTSSTGGGAYLQALSDEAGETPFVLEGAFGATDPTDFVPAVVIRSSKRSGTGKAALSGAEIVLQVQNWGSNLLTVMANGKIGVGINNPNWNMQIHNATAGSDNYLQFTQDGTGTDATDGFMIGVGTAEDAVILNRENTSLFFYTNNTLRQTISNAGALRLHAYGAGTLVTDASGNVTASSDERLKDVQGSFSRGLSDILNLDPILYKWNGLSGMETSGTYAGFSAQDVQGAIPEAVSTDSRGYLTLQDRPILAASVNAIKELDGSLSDLEDRVTALESATGTSPNFTSLNVSGHTTLANLTVSGNVTIGGRLTVANAEVTGNLTIGGHIIANGGTPVIEEQVSLGEVAGGLPASADIDGTDTAGSITLVAGANTAKGSLAKIMFNQDYTETPRIVVTATNDGGLSLPIFVRKIVGGFEIVTANDPTPGVTYQFDYVIISSVASN
jgi:hypothetical protein